MPRMDLPPGVDPASVVVVGYTQRIPAKVVADFPELMDRTLEGMVSALAHRVEQGNLVPVGDITSLMFYEKHVEVTERPDWAADIDPPWYESVECEQADPEMSVIVAMMEVRCAPR